MPKIATILHYCTNDYRFLDKAIEECSHFSSQIIIPFADHFFDNKPENRFLLELSMKRHPHCTFIQYPFDVKRLYTPFTQAEPFEQDWLCYWHATSRYIGNFFVGKEIDWILFIDADEVVEGKRFKSWTEQSLTGDEKAFWFNAYMYGIQADQQKKDRQLTGLLLKKNALRPQEHLTDQERYGMFQSIVGAKIMGVDGLDGNPMIHHYSWVRSKQECLTKATTWAKKNQTNWIDWLKQSHEPFDIVPAYFNPLTVDIPVGNALFQTQPNELLVTRRQIMELEHALL